MPKMEYDFWRGELSLLNPVEVPLDAALSDLSARYAASDAETRAKMRRAISIDEFYTLLTFSKRAPVFALRERSAELIVNGLRAIAMIEAGRTDPRDILWSLSLLYHSATGIDQDADQLFREAAALAEPKVAEMLTEFPQRSAADKDLKRVWGYEEVGTPNGPGLIGWEGRRYKPTYDLERVAVEIAEIVTADRYQPDSVQIAADLPRVWLKTQDKKALDDALRAVRAVASVSARLRPTAPGGHEYQMLLVFVGEVTKESVAQTLRDLARAETSPNEARIAMAEGKLFCLLIATSPMVGGKTVETPESMSRLSAPIAEVLARCGA